LDIIREKASVAITAFVSVEVLFNGSFLLLSSARESEISFRTVFIVVAVVVVVGFAEGVTPAIGILPKNDMTLGCAFRMLMVDIVFLF